MWGPGQRQANLGPVAGRGPGPRQGGAPETRRASGCREEWSPKDAGGQRGGCTCTASPRGTGSPQDESRPGDADPWAEEASFLPVASGELRASLPHTRPSFWDILSLSAHTRVTSHPVSSAPTPLPRGCPLVAAVPYGQTSCGRPEPACRALAPGPQVPDPMPTAQPILGGPLATAELTSSPAPWLWGAQARFSILGPPFPPRTPSRAQRS